MAGDRQSKSVIDISTTLDNAPFTFYQKLIVFFAAVAVILDGFDSQLIGYAAPALMREWGLTRNEFMPAVVAGVFGMGVGATTGVFADSFGRKKAIMVYLLIFGVFTCLVGTQNNLTGIAIFRFLAGIGIGGALPIATTIAAEFTPQRYRTLIVTSTIVCVPLGGVVAGFFAEVIMPDFGWRMMFFIGGAMPIALMLFCIFATPETPKYLVRYPERWGELRNIFARMGMKVDAETKFTDVAEQSREKRSGYGALFHDNLARDTSAIWCAFFFCLAAVYAAFSWLPTMLTSVDIAQEVARRGLTAYNLGGVVGALVCAWFITKFGSFWPLILCSAAGALSALAIELFNVQNHITLLIVMLCLHGLFVNAVQSTMYALCAYIYPTKIRATGTSGALMFGRVGAIAAAFGGAPVITYGGATGYFWLLGGSMIIVTIALLVVRRHIPAAM
ncbi:MFS transporter [Bartonella sp. LJL80]